MNNIIIIISVTQHWRF